MNEIKHEDLNAIICAATQEVFATMLSMDMAAGDCYRHETCSLGSNGVASFIGLAGPWVGTGSISCSAAFACQIASQLMMADYKAVDDEVLDAVAEVTNMIIGNVKTALEERLGPIGISIPTVIYGRNFASRTMGPQEWTVVPFHAGDERLDVQVCLAPNAETSRARPLPVDVMAQV